MATQFGKSSSLHTPHKKIQSFPTPNSEKSTQNLNYSVRVIARVRPFLPTEFVSKNGENPSSCISLLNSSSSADEVTVCLKDQETSRCDRYKLNGFFEQEDGNVSQIFHNEVKPLIPGIFQGHNSTVFAYGATGSGKTYTLQGTNECPGLISLSMSNILEMCQSFQSIVKISYYEIYLEKCFDLLEPKGKEVSVLDDKYGKTHLKGLSQVKVNSMEEFYEVFSCAIQRRKFSHTCLNDASSRSHGVLGIVVSTPSADGTCNFVTGKLNLIDLAGNEDNRRTCNEGIRLQESAKINQSLFTLSNVIYALKNNKPRVPYRESKLTRILQDSLGGKSHALMVACLNPSEYQESVNTVSLAARSCNVSIPASPALVKDAPKTKVNMDGKLRAWLDSKGKTKSSQKMVHFASPLISMTPRTINSSRKMPVTHSSAKQKTNQGATRVGKGTPHVAIRNLFQPASPAGTYVKVEDLKPNQTTEFLADLPAREVDKAAITDESVLCVNDSVNEKSEWFNADELPSQGQSGNKLLSPLRKVFSPISPNVISNDILVTDQVCPMTPSAQYSPKSADKLQAVYSTPLDKYQSRSSNLKNVLIREYIEFLNDASREELLEIKGIGHKMADYIVELRETSPLKSLSDLGKLGLSSRQVLNMFGKAARDALK